MGARGPQQLEAIRFGLCQCLLVAKNNAGGIVLYPAESDEPTALHFLVSAWNSKPLRVNIDRRLRVLNEDALPSPIEKKSSSASISILTGMVTGLLLAENNADEIVGACGVIAVLHLWRDLVVGLSDHIAKGNPCRIITEGAKRLDVSHDSRIQILP